MGPNLVQDKEAYKQNVYVVCKGTLGGRRETVWKGVWGCQGEAWGPGPKVPQAYVCLSLMLQVRNFKTVLILEELLRNIGMGTNVREGCEVSVCECEQECVHWV